MQQKGCARGVFREWSLTGRKIPPLWLSYLVLTSSLKISPLQTKKSYRGRGSWESLGEEGFREGPIASTLEHVTASGAGRNDPSTGPGTN